MLCGYAAADLQSIGSFMQGVGSILGAACLLIAAWLGTNTFNSWKRQRVEERRGDLAEVVLTLAYRLQWAITYIRSSFSDSTEADAAAKVLQENGIVKDAFASEAHFLRIAQVTLNRVHEHSHLLDELANLRPKVRAIFGSKVEHDLAELSAAVAKVANAASRYAGVARALVRDDAQLDALVKRKLGYERVFWEGGGFDDEGNVIPDLIKEQVDEAVAALEGSLQPHLMFGK